MILSGGLSYFYFRYFTTENKHFATFLFVFMLAVANSASPLVIRFIADLRLGTSDFGRLATCSSLVNDITIILIGAVLMKITDPEGFKWYAWLWSLLFTGLISFAVRRIAILINRLNPEYQYLRNHQIVPLFLLVLLSASFVDKWGAANSIVTALIIGVAFPREGKTARTMYHKLSFAVYTFVLPVYFGYTGFQANFGDAIILKNFIGCIVVLLLSIGGKILGTLVACRRLKIPTKEGIVLGLLLNLKGHSDVLILGVVRARADWNDRFVEMMLITIVLNTLLSEHRIFIRQMKIVASVSRIFEDICEAAEDLRASILILPFHKHQRIDGKMESGRESIRSTNHRVLRHAPCTVAVLIDRGLGGFSRVPDMNSMQHVATLFFGGPDDREALSLSTHIAMHLGTNLAVIRFVQASERDNQERINISLNGNEQVLMAMPSRGAEDDVDNAFLEEFYNRYVTSGQVAYMEKHMKDGAQTAAALRDLVDMYQLFIVGNGGRRNTTITTGISDWEECPELGNVGDLLASSEFDSSCSVLVIQQYRPPTD